jgi:hypothetical protein
MVFFAYLAGLLLLTGGLLGALRQPGMGVLAGVGFAIVALSITWMDALLQFRRGMPL